jgi:hypothetical protein
VEKAMILWMKQLRDNNLPLSPDLLVQKSRFFAEKLGEKNFVGSSKFIQNINKRCGISFMNIRGESASVETVTMERWIPKLTDHIKDMDPKDVYNWTKQVFSGNFCQVKGLFSKMKKEKE